MSGINDAPRLYVLMRTDLASMNPGKAVAQGAHAANQCVRDVGIAGDADQRALLEMWEDQTVNGFGTTITLGVNEAGMRSAVTVAKALGLHAGTVHDPTYPLIDGDAVHLIPLDTCAFVFGRSSDCSMVLGRFSLMA